MNAQYIPLLIIVVYSCGERIGGSFRVGRAHEHHDVAAAADKGYRDKDGSGKPDK